MNYIDLFAGAGGLSDGFIRAGYEPIVHVEMDEAACYTLKTRVAYHYLKATENIGVYRAYLRNDITREQLYGYIPRDLLSSVINLPIGGESNSKIHSLIDDQLDQKNISKKDVDLIIGGPPCQAYSVVGRARSENGMKGDPRNYLYVQYARYLETYQPKMFVFENVLGLKSAQKGIFLSNMERLFEKKGYKIEVFTVEANNFNVLQNRKRIIIIGWKDDFVPTLPDLEAVRLNQGDHVESLLKDLPPLNAGEGKDKYMDYARLPDKYLRSSGIRERLRELTQHVARPHTQQDKEIYKIVVDKWNNHSERLDYNSLPEKLKTHSNRDAFVDRFKVVAANCPYSQTVVAHIAKDGHYYIHPDITQNRSLTVREAARLQSFPDSYYFEGVKEKGSRTAAFKQIGNAVPPLMAYEIAKVLKPVLESVT
ncbi:DNA cytosine methyltransferase [Chitinophaga horti]|uniref:Cytosine-specific methyltransferase n=1 Tax=Chitinophaga horti TaxID=2920382 RepID=A0ABY6J5J2_9BACT|nr:DNA cytosine methyltransferase [Chitinophaga horti]UYQ94955.1 DNA cytosine methyltransferase [Chitinophaga horti]